MASLGPNELTHCVLTIPYGNKDRPGSTWAQVMACCLTAPCHYLNWCWHFISGAPESPFPENTPEFNLSHECENHTFKISGTYPRGQWVNPPNHILSKLITDREYLNGIIEPTSTSNPAISMQILVIDLLSRLRDSHIRFFSHDIETVLLVSLWWESLYIQCATLGKNWVGLGKQSNLVARQSMVISCILLYDSITGLQRYTVGLWWIILTLGRWSMTSAFISHTVYLEDSISSYWDGSLGLVSFKLGLRVLPGDLLSMSHFGYCTKIR